MSELLNQSNRFDGGKRGYRGGGFGSLPAYLNRFKAV
jgi:hypothetical protein